MGFRDDLAGAIESLPPEALERILKAAEADEAAGSKALADELADGSNWVAPATRMADAK